MDRIARFIKRRSQVVLTFAIFVASATAAEKQYTYCWSASLNSGSNIQFFSKVFLADSDWRARQTMEVAYQEYLRRNYRDLNPGSGDCNRYYSSKERTQESLDFYENGARGDGGQVIETGWAYSPDSAHNFPSTNDASNDVSDLGSPAQNVMLLLVAQETPHFHAKGTHKCQGDKSIGHECEVEGEFLDCNEAYYKLKMQDCCPQTKDGGSSIGFTIDYCLPQ